MFIYLLAFALPLTALEEEDLRWENTGPSVQEYNSALQQAILDQNWWSVIDYATVISYNFATTPFAEEASFIMGEAYYKLGEYEQANECLSAYLQRTLSPKHFEEAISYKFQIAEFFAGGGKKRLFSSVKMPAWADAKEDALPIYDDVIASLPHSEMAAKSMLGKAKLQAYTEDFKPSLETLDLLIRKFPKDVLAADAFLEKARVYVAQCQVESLDPDALDLSEMNLRKFKISFPRDPKTAEAEKLFKDLQEMFAQNLFETGAFFQKTNKPDASRIYYNKVIAKFPETEAAKEAAKRLEILPPTP